MRYTPASSGRPTGPACAATRSVWTFGRGGSRKGRAGMSRTDQGCGVGHGLTEWRAAGRSRDEQATAASRHHRGAGHRGSESQSPLGHVQLDTQGFALAMLALIWLNPQRQPLPPPEPPAPDSPVPDSRSIAPWGTLPFRDRSLRLDVARPSNPALSIPRQLCESVQEIRGRVIARFAMTVHREFARRGTSLQLPIFVRLC